MAPDEKRSTVVSVRFTDQEAAELRAVAGGRPVSQLVRELALDGLKDGGHHVGRSRSLLQPTSTAGNAPTLITSSTLVSTARSQGFSIIVG